MKRFLLLVLTTGLLSPVASKAEVDSKVHKMCLQAKDYMGCVKAQTTNSKNIPSLRVIQGKTELTGNSCPKEYAYSGAGYCNRVICGVRRLWTHHPDLRDKGWQRCYLSGLLDWSADSVKAVVDPKCPDREPIIGTNSSCVTQADLDKIQVSKTKKKPLACRNGTWSPNHPQCKESESTITSPMDID